MMLTISLTDQDFFGYFDRLQDRLGNLEPVLVDIGQSLENRVSARFETQTDPLGHHWKAWAESTLESYPFSGTKAAKKHGVGNGRILDRYSDMLRSLNIQATADHVRIGFGKDYSTYHEYGTRKMPRRGLMYGDPVQGTIAPSDEAMVLDILSKWLAKPV